MRSERWSTRYDIRRSPTPDEDRRSPQTRKRAGIRNSAQPVEQSYCTTEVAETTCPRCQLTAPVRLDPVHALAKAVQGNVQSETSSPTLFRVSAPITLRPSIEIMPSQGFALSNASRSLLPSRLVPHDGVPNIWLCSAPPSQLRKGLQNFLFYTRPRQCNLQLRSPFCTR